MAKDGRKSSLNQFCSLDWMVATRRRARTAHGFYHGQGIPIELRIEDHEEVFRKRQTAPPSCFYPASLAMHYRSRRSSTDRDRLIILIEYGILELTSGMLE